MKQQQLPIALALTATLAAAQGPEPVEEPRDASALAAHQRTFAFELYGALREAHEGNVVCSPMGLYSALGSLHHGARGESAKEISHMLDVPAWSDQELLTALGALTRQLESDSMGSHLAIADALWAHEDLRLVPGTALALKRALDTKLASFRYGEDGEEARERINTWCSGQTSGLVPELLKPGAITPTTQLVLTNAVYFHGSWKHPFEPQASAPRAFYGAAKSPYEVPFLHDTQNLLHAAANGVQVVRMPFQLERTAVYLVVPDARDGLAQVEQELSATRWEAWRGALQPARIHLALPKLELRQAADLNGVLAALGGDQLFGGSADLSGFAGRPGQIGVDQVLQETVWTLDEEGVEAASATAITHRALGSPMPTPDPITVTADRPFLLVLADEATGAILFLSRVADPRG